MLLNRLLLLFGLRRRVDGWRRGAGLVLRGESAKFVLSAFALDMWSDQRASASPSIAAAQDHLASRLATFLATEPELHRCIRCTTIADRAEICAAPSYILGFEPWVDGPARFVPPDSWDGKDYPAGTAREPDTRVLMNIICRINPNGAADIWMRVNHVGIDGVPVQDVLTRLEQAWGSHSAIVYPTPNEFTPFAMPRKCPGRDGIVELQTFADFTPLLDWRKRKNATLSEPMTLSAAILWCLARHESFSGLYMGTTVELPANNMFGRGVGIVVVQPAKFFSRPNGLNEYVRDFNHQVDQTRTRTSSAIKTLDAAALIPAQLETELLRSTLEQGGSAFGSLCLSILRDAKVFGAPLADAGQADGFLALGSIALPTGDGTRVGCVTIKGPAARIASYPMIIEQVIQRCRADML